MHKSTWMETWLEESRKHTAESCRMFLLSWPSWFVALIRREGWQHDGQVTMEVALPVQTTWPL